MSQDTNVNNLIINKLTKQQYEGITNPDPTQLYFITDDNGITSLDDISLSSLSNGQILKYNSTSGKWENANLPAEVTETTVTNWGFTKNVGTVTSVNNVSPVNGNVSLTIPDPLPTQTGNSGKYLTTNGTTASWATISIPTVDQTYDSTSTNAQSGVAIAGANFLQNTATGTNALTILGTAATSNTATNVGTGTSVTATAGTAIGRAAEVSGTYGTGLGTAAKVTAAYGIQIGYGTNSTASTLSVGFNASSSANRKNWELLDVTTGLIPNARLSTLVGADGTNDGTAGIVPAPAASDNTKFLKGDGTWATVDALPSQTSQSGKFLTTNGTTASWDNIPTEIPTQTGNSGKYLTTNGTTASWSDVYAMVITDYTA